jgi:hypothetical protein
MSTLNMNDFNLFAMRDLASFDPDHLREINELAEAMIECGAQQSAKMIDALVVDAISYYCTRKGWEDREGMVTRNLFPDGSEMFFIEGEPIAYASPWKFSKNRVYREGHIIMEEPDAMN